MSLARVKKGIFAGIKGKVRFREPLKKHTTFKIGGPADFFIEPHSLGDLKLSLETAKKQKMPVLVIGRGSNILAPDKGVKGMVICLNSRFFSRVFIKGKSITAGAGAGLGQILQTCLRRGLSGLEFLSGIPGALGGALAMNAGAWGNNIGCFVKSVKVMDYNGRIKNLSGESLKFGYRKSNLSKFIVLEAELRLSKEDKKEIRGRIKEYLEYRRDMQDNSFPSAGCVFKNPGGKPAGKLIDLCGLKGRRLSGACVSDRHANFILNRANARAQDVIKLMALIKKRVKQEFNISLQPEIKIWP